MYPRSAASSAGASESRATGAANGGASAARSGAGITENARGMHSQGSLCVTSPAKARKRGKNKQSATHNKRKTRTSRKKKRERRKLQTSDLGSHATHSNRLAGRQEEEEQSALSSVFEGHFRDALFRWNTRQQCSELLLERCAILRIVAF